MRKEQKQAILDLLKSLHQVHEEIRKALEQKNFILAQNMISEAQESAILLGENIEKTEGEGHRTVSNIEEYCELLFTVFEAINKNDFHPNKVYKILRKQLIKIENSVKNDIIVRMEIVFFPYKASMWDSLESIYLAAKADPDCDAYCVPIPYYDVNQDHSLGQMHYEGNEYPEDVEITDWQKYNFEERKPDVIYIHNPYDAWNLVTSVHPRYYSFNLKKYTDTLVYVPYYVTSGGMMEAQGSLPSYQYVDYIVIQSPQFREYFDPKIPKEKFLPFGSPKIDRVIRKCQNPPEPPAEWSSKMTGRDGGRKRVIFYNTGINAMLKDTETFFKKMAYVFQCFIGREDVCLLWRPHPLLESTLDSMRPEFRPVYDGLKERFLTEQLGIYDTASDIEESIALSDAYIGDAGTSITALFGVVGKPIFILNDQILEEPGEEDWRKDVPVSFDYQEPENRFNIIQGNKLYVSKPYQYDYRYFCDLTENDYVNCYLFTYEMNGKWYVCPSTAQDILVVGEKGVEKKIELKKMSEQGMLFYFPRKSDSYIFLLPVNYPAIVRCNTVTGEIRYFTEHIETFVKEKNGQKITGGSLVYQGVLYIASPTDNMVYKLDIESGESTAIDLPIQSRCGGHVLIEYEGEIWFLPYDGQVIVRWNPDTNQVREYEGFPEGFSCKNPADDSVNMEKPFCMPAFWGKDLYLPSCLSNMSLKLNIDTGEFKQWLPPYKEWLKSNESGMFLHWKPDERENCFEMYSFFGRKLYKINFDEDAVREIEIRFDKEELESNEQGFCEYPDPLAYVCVENYFNTLDRFLDGNTVGNRFEKEKQLAAYRKIIADSDGECGKNTYVFIKREISKGI